MYRNQALDYAARLERLALMLPELEMSEVDHAVTCNCAVCRMWRDGVCARCAALATARIIRCGPNIHRDPACPRRRCREGIARFLGEEDAWLAAYFPEY
jgi:hypothetical protein